MKDGGHLEITASQANENFVEISFADNGPGIPRPDLKHVFEPFFYTKAGYDGTGVGLSVTYAIVQEIGGKIAVDSQVGKGTCFTISIPLERPDNN